MNRIDIERAPEPAGRPFGVEIQHLLTFLAIYEEKRVTHAARRLGRTQSALSHSLARLREIMDDELFVARAGDMWPTAEAQQLYPRIKSAVALIDSLQIRKRAFEPAKDALDLRIGMTDYAQRIFSPRIWAALASTAPGVRMLVQPVDRYNAEGLLIDGTIDLAIVGDAVVTQPAVLCDELMSDDFVVATAAPGSPQDIHPLDMKTYVAASHLRVAARESEFGVVDAALRAAGYRRLVRCIVPHYLQVPAMLAHSDLFATFARGVFIHATEPLLLRPPPFEIAPVRIGLLHLHPSRSSSAQRWACDLVHRIAAELEPQSVGMPTP